ncbi:hypothetical protein M9H77_27804 [Catharanthus roseus]|uniref:Uncharacterized protein n=1 Tax=Catharanthus roseus TaxID=4058 RepID=A0ACC0AHR0_CATRO|nr:hypothetical protein M9H77_27804 [Catharanthus roseus]
MYTELKASRRKKKIGLTHKNSTDLEDSKCNRQSPEQQRRNRHHAAASTGEKSKGHRKDRIFLGSDTTVTRFDDPNTPIYYYTTRIKMQQNRKTYSITREMNG